MRSFWLVSVHRSDEDLRIFAHRLCRGVISIGHNEANGLNANGRAVFSTLYDNTHLGEKQQLIFTYEQGDILRLQEYDTCIIHSELSSRVSFAFAVRGCSGLANNRCHCSVRNGGEERSRCGPLKDVGAQTEEERVGEMVVLCIACGLRLQWTSLCSLICSLIYLSRVNAGFWPRF